MRVSCLAYIHLHPEDTTADLVFLLERFDRVNREALTNILGVPLSDQQLPVAMGGLGMRGALDHAPGAYTAFFLASQSLSKKLQGRQEDDTPAHLPNTLLTTLIARFGEEEVVMVEQLEMLSQKTMSY